MRNVKLTSVMWAGALVLGLVLGASAQDARAGEAKGKAKAEEKTEGKAAAKSKGKAGDTCKVDEDCDQSSRPMTCRQSGDSSKCVAVPIHPAT